MYLLSVLTEHKVYSIDQTFYYFSKDFVYKGSRVSINFHKQYLVGFVLDVNEVFDIEKEEKELGFKIKEITDIIDEKPILNDNLINLAYILKERYFVPLISILNTMLPPSLRGESSSLNKPKIAYDYFYELINIKYIPINKNEEKILKKFDNLTKIVGKNLIYKSKTLDALVGKNVIKLIRKEKYRYKIEKSFEYSKKIELSSEQNKVFKNILISNNKLILLKGVTGSGKTEIYIKLIEEALLNGGSALILVPEVALTPLMISRIISYFDEEIAVLHSSLKPSERYDEYRKISQGIARIVIGTRSAIFAPLKNLKYIIIDEEHDESYKQDFDFTYSAKDVAILRSSIENLKVIFGSATPSIESMAKALNKQYDLEELHQKYYSEAKNSVEIIDIKDKEEMIYSSIFSKTLIQKIAENLKNSRQIILLVNKRGYARSVICNECGYVYKCLNCNLPLIYHRDDDSLRCHHCDYKIKFINKCPICDSKSFKLSGIGIERVVEEFKKLFKNIPFGVLNSDDTPTLNEIQTILKKFNNKEIKVLIGTQIVAKGHDFKDVSLVGIIDADSLINIPTFKAHENAFSLLVQTIGRSGRFIDGEAYIQTSLVNNKIINYAINNDYNGFFNYEISLRNKYQYPPFYNLYIMKVCSLNIESLKKEVYSVTTYLKRILGNNIVTSSFLQNKYKNYFSYEIAIKTKNLKETREILKEFIDEVMKNKELRIYIDFY